jgi:hypothetical protein
LPRPEAEWFFNRFAQRLAPKQDVISIVILVTIVQQIAKTERKVAVLIRFDVSDSDIARPEANKKVLAVWLC